MRVYECPGCGSPLFPRNLACVCGAAVAFDPEVDVFLAFFESCANREQIGCEWVAERPGGFCRSCAMTAVVPDSFHHENVGLWAEAEAAKRWVLTGLARWGWFAAADTGRRPVFHLLSERTRDGEVAVTMGHAAGVITVNVIESDPVERVRRREALGESYRTMIGHFRHELAHMLFDRLAEEETFQDAFRERFGDERADYGAALGRYYETGPVPDWAERHLSPYASSHPHEDWAETAAHLMHLTDIIDSAAAMGARAGEGPAPDYDAYAEGEAGRLVTTGLALGIALNHVNRAMGLPDLYPFVLGPVARDKLGFAHRWLKSRGALAAATREAAAG